MTRKADIGHNSPIVLLNDSDLIQNGGSYKLAGKTAQPVHFVHRDTTYEAGGRTVPIYLARQQDVNSGNFSVAGGHSRSVTRFSPENVRVSQSKIATPVYAGDYATKVLLTKPDNLLGYWRLGEKVGTRADNYQGLAIRDGVYSGVTLNGHLLPDGEPCPDFNGTSSYVNIYTADLASNFDGDEGSVSLWYRTRNIGVWSDGSARQLFYIQGNGTGNRIDINKFVTSNRIQVTHVAASSIATWFGGRDDVEWLHICLTWSSAANEIKWYINGVQQGATIASLGTWVGPLTSTACVIGAVSTTPTQVTNGYIGNVALWGGAPLSQEEVVNLSLYP